ncbi:MAG: serine/threonine-protein kinase [Planctomycetaceae bacterium]
MTDQNEPTTEQRTDLGGSGPEFESTQVGDSVEMLDSLGAFMPSMPAKAPNLPSQSDASTLNAGDVIDDFQVLKVLGKGAFGSVYLARQLSLGRMVAIKITPNKGGSEGKTMAPLEHPHIVQVFSETTRRNGRERLLCMQYVPGTTLAKVLQRLRDNVEATNWNGRDVLNEVDGESQGGAALDPAALRDRERLDGCRFVPATAMLGEQLAEALEFAHQKGVLHRDIKPANVLISQYGRTLLVDFNLSLRDMDEPNQSSVFGGTLSYMSPEHLEAFNPLHEGDQQSVDERSDLFSLGVVLFQMRTGDIPFGSPSDYEDIDRLELLRRLADDLKKEPTFPEPINEADRALQAAIGRCLAYEPADRFDTAAELREALRGVQSLAGSETQLADSAPRWWSWKRPVLWIGLLILVPQLIASVLNVTYNKTQLDGLLTPEQYKKFDQYVLIYNAVIWLVCVPWVYRLVKPLAAIATESVTDEPALRQHLMRLPRKAALVACVGWFSGIAFFPIMMHIGAGVGTLYSHFAVNLLVSGLIAIAYSALGVQYYCLRVLYPRLWTDASRIQSHAPEELSVIPNRVVLMQLLAGMIPLAGAMLVVLQGPEQEANYSTFRLMLGILIGLGIVGVQVATSVCQRISKTANAFGVK